jgi:hypothetical protein
MAIAIAIAAIVAIVAGEVAKVFIVAEVSSY